jgi:hypothetical protein
MIQDDGGVLSAPVVQARPWMKEFSLTAVLFRVAGAIVDILMIVYTPRIEFTLPLDHIRLVLPVSPKALYLLLGV